MNHEQPCILINKFFQVILILPLLVTANADDDPGIPKYALTASDWLPRVILRRSRQLLFLSSDVTDKLLRFVFPPKQP